MKTYSKRFLAVLLSVFLVIAPTIQQANAASSWSITGAVSAGARTIVSATKGGYKSAVNIMPTAARLGAGLLRAGNTGSLLYAASQLASDGIDFVLDPANNQIKYKDKSKVSREEAAKRWCKDTAARQNRGYYGIAYTSSNPGVIYCAHKDGIAGWGIPPNNVLDNAYMSVEKAAAQVLRNAQAGNTAAQAAVRAVATEMVVGGQFDQDLLAGAVPTSDTKPLIPAVPGNGNGNVTHGSDVGVGEGGTTGATPGQQADDAKAAADAAKRAADAAKDAAAAAAEAARDAADNAQDLVNSGADAAAQAAAEAAAKAAAQAAKDAAAAAAAAGERSAAQAAAAERAAAAATAAAKAAAEKAAKDLADAIAAGEQAAIDAAKAAEKAAAKELAEAKEKQAAAEKAAEKAKAEAAKPFELPAFCTWASIVCETAEWLKREPETPEITAIDTDNPNDDFDTDKSYVTFTGSCPPPYTASLNVMGNTVPFSFDYSPICGVMSALKPFIVGAGYLTAAYIIAGFSRGGSKE